MIFATNLLQIVSKIEDSTSCRSLNSKRGIWCNTSSCRVGYSKCSHTQLSTRALVYKSSAKVLTSSDQPIEQRSALNLAMVDGLGHPSYLHCRGKRRWRAHDVPWFGLVLTEWRNDIWRVAEPTHIPHLCWAGRSSRIGLLLD